MTSSSSPLSFSTIGSIHHHLNDIVPQSSLSLNRFTDRQSPSRSVKFTVKSSLNSGSGGGDPFGFYPWESSGGDNNNNDGIKIFIYFLLINYF